MGALGQVCLLLLTCTVGILAQTNTNRVVPRTAAGDKVDGCEYYDYVVFTDTTTGVVMVNRAQYIQLDLAGNRWTRSCAPGTLFSILATSCNCDTAIPVSPNFNRCVRIAGDFQGVPSFARAQTNDAGGEDTGTVYVEGFDDMPYSISSNCYSANVAGYPHMPFFRGNSLSFGSLNIFLRFSVSPAPTANVVFPLIVNDGVENNTRTPNPSFRLAYVLQNGVSSMQVTLRLRSLYLPPGSPETTVVLSCTIGPITRTGLPTLTWSVTDITNNVRLVGNLADINSMRIELRNDQTEGQTGIPTGGYCSDTTANPPIRARGTRNGGNGLIIAERQSALGFGLVPSRFQSCISNLEITRDC